MSTQFKVIQEDITRLAVDAIVNAANSTLLGGGGVDGAIHRAAGPALLAECRQLGGCPTGEAKITHGYQLPAKYVIHTVGPIWQGGQHQEARLLAACYTHSLTLALTYQIKTIAFPAISCGAYGYPLNEAIKIAVETTANWVATHPDMETIYFVAFNPAIASAYQTALANKTAIYKGHGDILALL